MPSSNRGVFINCSFDEDYTIFFRTIVFVVIRSGFRPRCALETDDSSENRFDKICSLIRECRYGIHDISRTQLDHRHGLPRFNMPLELGLFLGAKRFGSKAQAAKRCMILDRDRYRFQRYISDISGQDIHSHQGRLETLIVEIASWLRTQSRDRTVPGGRTMAAEFAVFRRRMPAICAERNLELDELNFGDYGEMVAEYVAAAA